MGKHKHAVQSDHRFSENNERWRIHYLDYQLSQRNYQIWLISFGIVFTIGIVLATVPTASSAVVITGIVIALLDLMVFFAAMLVTATNRYREQTLESKTLRP